MKKNPTVFRWVGVTVFALMALVSLTDGGFLAALLFILGGAIIAPLNPIKNFREKLKLNKALSIVLAVILLCAGALTFPTSDTETGLNNSSITSSVSSNTSKEETTDSSADSSIDSSSDSTTDNSTDSSVDTKDETTNNSSTDTNNEPITTQTPVGTGSANPISLSSVPTYSGTPYVTINNNVPNFSATELKTTGYETYSELDNLGRTGVAIASVGKDTMPKDGEKRGDISSIKPTGWVQAQYDCISGGWLYNRCHLIGWQLSAENANKKNLLTGTKYFNVSGMLPFENMVADYIKETGNHVAYRVTPIYDGTNLLASGVQIEAYSIEDKGDGIQFNVFCYNVQPEITIDYTTGNNTGPISSSTETPSSSTTTPEPEQDTNTNTSETVYISKTGSKYHSKPNCGNMKNGTPIDKDEAIEKELEPCKNCH